MAVTVTVTVAGLPLVEDAGDTGVGTEDELVDGFTMVDRVVD